MRSFLVRSFFYFVFLALFFFSFMFFIQRYLLYFPSNREPPNTLIKVIDDRCLTDAIHPAKGVMLVFHGNAGQASDRGAWIKANPEYQVILAEYPGYGHRDGNPTEDLIIKDAVDIARKVKQSFPGDFILIGESLGTGVAAGVASQVAVEKMVMVTPFDSVKNVAKVHYGLLGLDNLVIDTFDSVQYLKDYHGKMVIIMGGQDNVVPNANTENLISHLQIKPKVWKLDSAGHVIPLTTALLNDVLNYLNQ